MTATIYINGEIGKETTLLGVIRQFKSFKNPTEVEVVINSNGGEVYEGQDIYLFLRKLNLPITTKAVKAYSIAASIFMAGDIRLLEEGNNRFMMHMPLAEVRGSSKTLEMVQAKLQEIEDDFTKFYSKYTSIEEDTIRRLLENETYLSAEEAVELGIATGTYKSFRAVAHINNDKKTEMTKTEKLIKAFTDFISYNEEEVIKAELILQDATGVEIKFPELSENDVPEVGDKVDHEDGEILMPDGSKIIVEEGKVKELVDAPEEDPQPEQPEPQPEPEAKEEKEVNKEDEVDFSALLTQFEERIIEKIKAENKAEKEALEAQITALKKEIGSEMKNEPKKPNQNYLHALKRK